MNIHRILASMILLCFTLITPVQADKLTQGGPVEDTSQNLMNSLELLQFHMQELNSQLAQQPQNMNLIKTETSWIRKHLRDLQDNVVRLNTDEEHARLAEELRSIIHIMSEEVGNDDMLDTVDLQLLISHYKRADQILSEIGCKK